MPDKFNEQEEDMAEQFDVVIAGASHNSLVTAAYLAKAGLTCLVLEARPHIGGDTATEELTLPGFLHDTCSTSHAIFMESPIWRNQELPLAEYGLEYITSDLPATLSSLTAPPSPNGLKLTVPVMRLPDSRD